MITMCGRYTAAKDFSELIKLVGVIMSRMPIFGPRYNIAPTQLAPVIYHEHNQPAMKLMRWGLIPSWAKDESVGNAHINARSETLQSRNSFREAFKHRRCLIPADSFYEWQEREGRRQPFRVMLKSGEPFCFAGLWERWIIPPSRDHAETDLDEAPPSETIESFTIITRASNAAIAPLHDRMPVIIAPSHFGWWLKDDDSRSESHKMVLERAPDDALKIYTVSDLVNSPKMDGGSVVSSFSPGLAVFIQASIAMTHTVAAWAMHMSRAVVAKASFSFSSASEVGTNMSGPSAPTRKRVGAIFPLLRIQNSA
jgi:putative SOS response-associated peptidase YedK